MRSYTSLMSKIHLREITESITASTNIYQIFQQFPCANKSQHIPLTALFWKERSVKKIQCDGSKTPLRTLLLFQGRTAAVGLVLLAVIHLLAGTDSKDKRMGEVCLFQVNIPPGLPTSPKQIDLQESWRELVNTCTMTYIIYLFYSFHFLLVSGCLSSSSGYLQMLVGTLCLCIPSTACLMSHAQWPKRN